MTNLSNPKTYKSVNCIMIKIRKGVAYLSNLVYHNGQVKIETLAVFSPQPKELRVSDHCSHEIIVIGCWCFDLIVED